MIERPKLEVAWDVDVPSAGFAERVTARVTALHDALDAAALSSRVELRLVAQPSPPEVDGKRYRLLPVAVAAAAAVAFFVGALPGQGGDGQRFEASEHDGLETRTQLRLGHDQLARDKPQERLADDRSVANGGNTAINPEAGSNGIW